MTVALALSLLGGIGLALAASDESAAELPLDGAGHDSYFVYCGVQKDLTHCTNPSIWENTNGVGGLQRSRNLATNAPSDSLVI